MKKILLPYLSRSGNNIHSETVVGGIEKFTKNLYLGDMAISYEIVNKRSAKSNFFIEFDKTWIHGYLHLLGYDHKKLKNFKKMDKKENLILNYFYKKN